MELLTYAGSACIAILIFALIKILWKKPTIFRFSPFTMLIPFVLTGILSALANNYNHCAPYTYQPLVSMDFLSTIVALSFFFSSLLFVLVSVGFWIRDRKNQQRAKEAKKHIGTGLFALVLTVLLFVGFLFLINILGLGIVSRTICINTPEELQHIKFKPF